MKTLLTLSSVGWLAFALLGCGGNDDGPGLSVPVDASHTTDAEVNEADPPAGVEANPPPAHLPEDPATDPTPLDDTNGIDADPSDVTSDLPQELEWRPCGQFEDRELECAELEVPLDYEQPDGDSIWIAMRRILASPLEPYRGALLFNPGGPGGPGIDSAIGFFKDGLFNRIAPGFDIIGFDPRGIAESGERGCGIAPASLYASTPSADVGGLQGTINYYEERGEECEKQWGPLFRKIGSNNVVRDMEQMRKALGESKLNFLGGSYGTRLGALYAHEYPHTTGRIVLDAPVPPRASFIEETRGQFYETIELNELFFQECEATPTECPPNGRELFEEAVSYAVARGLGEAFVGAWTGAFARPDETQALATLLANEVSDPGGDWIERFVSSGEEGGVTPFASVTCTDDQFEPPTLEQLDSIAAEFAQASPILSLGLVGVTTLCAAWPTTPDPVPLLTAKDASPLLVIGGTFDSRTPYPWAQALTESLGNATLLTSNHFGHGAVLWGGDCVLDYVRAYLTSGSMPAAGTTCL